MLPMKLDLTEELAATLRQLRLDHPVNGEVLTAENLSKAIGNNRAWMSQIESRRLKKIRREDIIAIYKVFRDAQLLGQGRRFGLRPVGQENLPALQPPPGGPEE